MKLFADLRLANAECPVWNAAEGMLYWADIPNGRMYRQGPGGDAALVYEAGEPIGALVAGDDGSILQGLGEGRVQAWRDGAVEVICPGISAERGRRFNDGTADPEGRLLLGTMPGGGPAAVYRFDAAGYRRVVEKIGQSNGMAFSLDGKTLYLTDTKAKVVRAYEYGADEVCGGREIIRVESADAVPDGLAIDEEGNLWSAHWGGGCVVRYRPDGSEISRIQLPTAKVSSVAFGGDRLDLMFVTTAGGDDPRTNGPLAGAVFVDRVGVRGHPVPLVHRTS